MPCLLVVDDDRYLGLLYEQEFLDDGYDVILARNGSEALAKCLQSSPDLVILDLDLPDMDGLEVLERIMLFDKTMPVVLNTAYSNYQDRFMCWAADAYVIKSGDLTELKGRVREFLWCRRQKPLLFVSDTGAGRSMELAAVP